MPVIIRVVGLASSNFVETLSDCWGNADSAYSRTSVSGITVRADRSGALNAASAPGHVNIGTHDRDETRAAAGLFNADDKARTPVTAAVVRNAEKSLGYRLPAAFVDLLKVQNGGSLKRHWFPTTKCPRWAKDHVQFRDIMGLGEDGIDDETGSQYLIEEWEYPDVAVVISTDGHTAFMLA